MERIKLIELDIDVSKLTKNASDSQKNIEALKQEISFFKGVLKENDKALELNQDALIRLSNQGKASSKEAQERRANIVSLTKSQEENRQKIELHNSALRTSQKEYSTQKNLLDIYNKTSSENIKIIKETDGSIAQLGAALSANRKQYKELTETQRKETTIGLELAKVIQEQDKKFKELNTEIGINQVNVGNYKDAIKEALTENTNLSKTLDGQIQKIPVVGGTLSSLYQKTVQYTTAQRGATLVTDGSSKSLKLFKVALASTGIGILVIALGSLIAYLTSTQEGINKVNKILIPLKTVFQSLFGLVQNIGKALFDAFANPKKTMEDLGNFVKTNLINRFKAFGVILEGIMELDFKKVTNGVLQAGTGVEDVIGKTQNLAKQTGEFLDEAYKRGERIAEIQRVLSSGEADFITKIAEGKEQFKEQNKLAEDQTKTLAEREAATLKSIEILKETNKIQRERNALELELLQLKAASNDTSDADRAEIARKVAELKEANASMLEAETTQQNKLNTIRKEAYSKAVELNKKRVEAEIKSSQVALERYIIESDKINSTLNERISFFKTTLQKENDILKKELNAQKITREEYNLAVLKNNEEYAKKVSEATVDNLQYELDLYIAQNQSKVEKAKELTQSLVTEEETRLQEIYNRNLSILEEQRVNELISEQDFLLQKLALQEDYLEQKTTLTDDYNTQEKEKKDAQKQTDKEIEIADAETNFEEQRIREQQQHDLNLTDLEERLSQGKITNEQYNKLVEQENERHAKVNKAIDDAVLNTKLKAFSDTFGNIKELLGEHTAAGKAAGIAQATINTYQGVTEVWKAPSFLPEPFNTISKVAASAVTVASGLAAVKKITSTKTKYQDGGYLEGKSHAQGGIPFTINGQSGFEAEGGEFIVNKVSTTKFRPLLEKINGQYKIGKTAPSTLYQNGGIVTNTLKQSQNSQSVSIDYEQMAYKIGEKVGEANRQLPPPRVAVDDINTGQTNYAQVVNGANL